MMRRQSRQTPKARFQFALFISMALSVSAAFAAASSPAFARKMTLPQLLEMIRSNPGLQAGAAATSAMEAQVTEAYMNWLPQGDLLSLLAPSPNIRCYPGPAEAAADPNGNMSTPNQCLYTNSPEASLRNVSWDRLFTRTELKLIQPVWDFGKISAGVAAAKAGVSVAKQREAGARADLELNVKKAYYGLKFAREALDTLDEASGYVDEAQKTIEKDLANGTGNVSVTDRLRLRTMRAELDGRILEAKRLQNVARDGLRALLGPDVGTDIDVDDDPFEPPEITPHPVAYYEDLARANRPEVRLLESAVAAKRALADLERRREYPDLVLIGTAAFARAQTVDDPNNAFMSHYFNSTTAGVAAGLRMQLDLGPKIARAHRIEMEAAEIQYRRSEGLNGILLDVRKSYAEVTEAMARVESMDKGQKAGKAWISAVAQNFAVGVAETRDFTDALVQSFTMKTRYLQAVFDLDVALGALSRATGTSDIK
jgi:outer membrane protein TolC